MFLKVLLPLKLDWTPSYSSDTPYPVGTRVRVKCAHKDYVGVVLGTDESPDVAEDKILPIEGPAEGLTDISQEELKFWEFLSSYYMCTMGEVFKAVYPQGRTEQEFVGARIAGRKARKGEGSRDAVKRTQRTLPSPPEVLVGDNRLDTYILEIEKTVSEGRDTLILVSDFKIVAEFQKKLKRKFGDSIACYAPNLSAARKRIVSEKIRGPEPAIVIGTKNAVLLPFTGLGLIIVDEEQDPSFKNREHAPRFNARDASVILAGIHGARIILGTSCPSFETLLNIKSGKYNTVCRTHAEQKPDSNKTSHPPRQEGHCVAIIDISAEKKKRGMRGDISFKLEDELGKAEGRIAIVRCYEKEEDLKEQLAQCFPDLKYDLLTPFEAQNGASRYALTAVMQADAIFDKSDFRSDERVLQALSRIAAKSDRTVVQTARASHPVFRILQGGTDATPLLAERKDFSLPPFSRIVDTVLTDRNPGRLKKFAAIIGRAQPQALRMEEDGRIIFRTTLPRTGDAGKKRQMMQGIRFIEKEYNYSGHIHFDVDPA